MLLVSTKKRWVTPSFDSFGVEATKKKSVSRKRAFRDTNIRPASVTSPQKKAITWLEKYQPQKVEELVIHPKKIKEVEEWFQNYMAKPVDKYLILNGPCGCGKTTVLRTLAKKFNFDIVEWITPLDREYDPDARGEDQTYQSAGEVFEQFLSRAIRYPSLLSVLNSKLILVKDFPNVFAQNPAALHDILRRFLLLNSYPLVFVCNDDTLQRNLFPDLLRKECNIRTINFNPVHEKAVIKALQRILDLERKASPNIILPCNLDLNAIYQSSTGDLRSAILKLYFNVAQIETVNEDNDRLASTGTQLAGNKDGNSDLFRLLGRVVYSNRKYSTSGLSDDYVFVHDPNELADTASAQPNSFISFLHENYMSRFSSIESISNAAGRLSEADTLLSRSWNKETHVLALAIANRGLMVANDKPVKSFKPFVKPRIYEEARGSAEFGNPSFWDDIRNTFPTFEHSPRNIILYTLPLLSKSTYAFDETQKRFVDKHLASFRE